jgi:hypothetical protein
MWNVLPLASGPGCERRREERLMLPGVIAVVHLAGPAITDGMFEERCLLPAEAV